MCREILLSLDALIPRVQAARHMTQSPKGARLTSRPAMTRGQVEASGHKHRATFVTHTDQMAHAKLSHNRQNSQTSATMTSHLV